MDSPASQVATKRPEPTSEEVRQQRLDENLAKVAKILTGIFVAIAGAGAAFGLSQDSLLVAVNNDLGLFVGVAVLALVAVALSVVSLFFNNEKPGNVWQVSLLGVGVIAYLAALVLTVAGVANYATGHGRPNVASLSVIPGSPVKVNFTVHADGVKDDNMVIAEAEAFNGETPMGGNPIYRTVLHADDSGDIEQKVEFVMERGEATRLTVRVFPDHGNKDGATCESSNTPHDLGCATVLLPLK